MSLTDLMSGAQLSSYAELGLALFLGAFVAVALRLLTHQERAEWSRASRLPLQKED
jgi:hypothetical protein